MPSTNGTALSGALAASLQAIEIHKILSGDYANLMSGKEIFFDARSHSHLTSLLVRNPACRFSHERWPLHWTPDLTLRDALALADGGGSDSRLFVPDSAFAYQLGCNGCGLKEQIWGILESLHAAHGSCPRCGARRSVRGFDLVEKLSAGSLPPTLLDRPLAERGFRPGEVFGVEAQQGQPARYFALGSEIGCDSGMRPGSGSDVVVAGLGNIGSHLAPLLARMSGIGRVTLCDPDVYEPGQQLSQDVGPDAVGRNKAQVQAERMCMLRPELQVTAIDAPVEWLPLGALAGAITVSCLDSLAARLRLAARAWRVGSPFVDAAVGGGSSLLVRTDVYLAEEGAACFECALESSDYGTLAQSYPCAGSGSDMVSRGAA